MSDLPSWRSSTLSQAFVLALLFYMAFLLMVTAGVIWRGLSLDIAEKIIPWGSALWGSVTAAYLAARKGNGNSVPEGGKP